MVEQDVRVVERHFREGGGKWRLATLSAASGRTRVAVPCLDAVLTLDEIYEGADVD